MPQTLLFFLLFCVVSIQLSAVQILAADFTLPDTNLGKVLKVGEGVRKINPITVRRCLSHSQLSYLQLNKLPKSLIVPDYLQAPLLPEKYLELSKIYGGGIYNFTLIDVPVAGENVCIGRSRNESRIVVYDLSRESEYVQKFEFYFTHDGYFKTETDQDVFFSPEHYCISSFDTKGTKGEVTRIKVHVCLPDKTRDVIIRKCCPLGSVVVLDSNDLSKKPTCIEVQGDRGHEWFPFWYRKVSSSSESDHRFIKIHEENINHDSINTQSTSVKKDAIGISSNQDKIKPYYVWKSLGCQKGINGRTAYNYLISSQNVSGPYLADIRVVENGEIFSRPTGNDKWDKPKLYRKHYINEFCIDGFAEESNQASIWNREEANQVIMFCRQDSWSQNGTRMYGELYFGLLIISLTFLFLTVVIYCLVLDKQNVHGWTIAAFSFTMFVNIFLHVIYHGLGLFQNYRFNSTLIKPGSQLCVIIGISLHFFYVSSFAWMTVLNFDLWATISSMTSLSNRSRGRKRFMAYVAFGYGVPAIVVSISLFLEFNFGIFSDTVIRPQYGHIGCGVDKSAVLAHQISVSCILLALSFLFAGLTIKSLFDFKRGTHQVQHSSSKAKSSYCQMKLIGKLFILMGFSWVFELVSWIVAGDEITWYWAILDSYNILQGIGLFWIFVCKKEIKDQLCEKFEFFSDYIEWVQHKFQILALKCRLSTSTTTDRHRAGKNMKESDSPRTSIADVDSFNEII